MARDHLPQDDYDGGGYARVNGDAGGYARVNGHSGGYAEIDGDEGGYARVTGDYQRSREVRGHVSEGSRQASRERLEEPPYATIGSIKENKERNKQLKRYFSYEVYSDHISSESELDV